MVTEPQSMDCASEEEVFWCGSGCTLVADDC